MTQPSIEAVDTRTVLKLRPFDARRIDYSRVKVVPLLDQPPEEPAQDTRTVIYFGPEEARRVDLSKYRVEPLKE